MSTEAKLKVNCAIQIYHIIQTRLKLIIIFLFSRGTYEEVCFVRKVKLLKNRKMSEKLNK